MHIREFNVAVRPAKLLQRVILSARNLLHLQLALSRYKIVLISRLIPFIINTSFRWKISKISQNVLTMEKCIYLKKILLKKNNFLFL